MKKNIKSVEAQGAANAVENGNYIMSNAKALAFAKNIVNCVRLNRPNNFKTTEDVAEEFTDEIKRTISVAKESLLYTYNGCIPTGTTVTIQVDSVYFESAYMRFQLDLQALMNALVNKTEKVTVIPQSIEVYKFIDEGTQQADEEEKALLDLNMSMYFNSNYMWESSQAYKIAKDVAYNNGFIVEATENAGEKTKIQLNYIG